MPEKKSICATRLLSDAPTKKDAFEHSSVAEAIAELVSTEVGAKCIGLTGMWGSGKSSVVEILSDKLREKGKENVDVFVFDAWAHQGDPLRRSFLEKLINWFVAIKWLKDPQTWVGKKDELARRRQITNTTSQQRLTPLGAAFATTVLLLPLGYALFVKYVSEPYPQFYLGIAGSCVVLFPFFLLACTWLAWRPSLKFWKATFWKTHRKPHNEESLLSLFLNRSQEKVESNTIRTPDPTSVEFQMIFGELLEDALSNPNRKLLIVVDNLDRVDAKDALAIWATLRTFFDFGTHADGSCLERLWLLLPFDETAIRKLWADSSSNPGQRTERAEGNGADLSQAFVDKTFQVTFRVSPPVLSDWHEFLKTQLKEAFPSHGDEDFHNVYRIYDLCAVVSSKPPTPREIKIFVNRIGAIHRRWGDEIALPVHALYVVLSKGGSNLAEDIALKGDDEILRSVPVDMVGKDWRESLAAIHFNVSKERALQVVIGGQLQDCLSSGDADKLKQLASIPGFTSVLEKQMENNYLNWGKGETASLAIAASTLGKVPDADDSSWNRTWDWLYRGTQNVKVWSTLDSRVADGIIQIVKRSPESKSLLDTVIEAVSNSFPKEVSANLVQVDAWLDGVFALLGIFRNEPGDTFERKLTVNASPDLYVRVMILATNKDKPAEFLQHLQPSGDRPAIVAELCKIASEGKLDEFHANAVGAMREVSGNWPWKNLVDAIASRLTATGNLPIPEVATLLSILLSFEQDLPDSKGWLAKLSQQGNIAHHLYFVSSDARATALCILPLIENIPAGNLQSAAAPNAAAGISVYNQILAAPESKQEVVIAFAGLITKYNKVDLLYDAPSRAAQTTHFVHAALKQVAELPNASNYIPVSQLIGSKDFIRTALGNESFEKFLSQTKGGLIVGLIARPFDIGLLDLYRLALRADKQDASYLEFLTSGLQALQQATWESQLTPEGEVLDLMLEIKDAGGGLGLGIEFEDALVKHAQQLVEGSTKVERLRSRWKDIFEGLEHDLQSATLQRMHEILCTSDKPTDQLLELYGAALSEPSVLSSNKDRVALFAFSKFIERLRVAELQWCCTVLEKNPNFLTEVNASTREDLQARITSAAQQQTIGEEVKAAILKLARLADVDLSKASQEEESS